MNTGGTEQAAQAPFAAPDLAARLLSPLRARRFDLLLHLVANLEQPLTVCGPEGSGKTTFLHLLGEKALENWRVILLDTTSRLTAQQAQDAILSALDSGPHDADSLLPQLARGGRLAVVLLDDAGRLPPLTLAELHRLARRFPALRLVLALRPEEARARASTNAGLFDDCHFLEVPSLDEAQCGAFLRQLALTPPRLLGVEEITPALVASIFRASQGIPGRILHELALRETKARAVLPRRASHWVGGLALALAAAFAVTAWVWRTPATSEAPMTPPVAEVAPIPVETSPPPEPMPAVTEAAPELPAPQPPVSEPAPSSPESVLQNPAESPAAPAPPPPAVTAPLAASSGDAPPEAQPAAAQPTPVVETPAAQPAAPSPPPPPQEKMDKALEKESQTTPPGADLLTPSLGVGLHPALQASKFAPGESVHAKRPRGAGQSLPRTRSGGQPGVKISLPAGVSGPDWPLAQNSTEWSLQIMSVSDLASIAALRKRYPELKDLSTYRAVYKGKTLYPVLYGLFSSEKEAMRAAVQLPESLGKPIPRRLGDIQRSVGAAMQGGMMDHE